MLNYKSYIYNQVVLGSLIFIFRWPFLFLQKNIDKSFKQCYLDCKRRLREFWQTKSESREIRESYVLISRDFFILGVNMAGSNVSESYKVRPRHDDVTGASRVQLIGQSERSDPNSKVWFKVPELKFTVVNGATYYVLLFVPNDSTVKIIFEGIQAAVEGNPWELKLFGGTTYSAIGTTLATPIGFNQQAPSPNAAELDVWKDPTVTSPGVLLDKVIIGDNSQQLGVEGGLPLAGTTFIPGTRYSLGFFNNSGSDGDIDARIFWREYTGL